MDILNLALFISKKFNIKVDISNEKNLKAFEKFDHILKLIKKKINEIPSHRNRM